MVESDLEIPQELRDKLRKQYGNIVDHIGMRRLKDSDDYEMSVIFRNRLRREPLIPSTDKFVVENSMYRLCNHIDKMIFDRKPNMGKTSQFGPNINILVSDKIPEGMIFISPETYQEMIANLCETNPLRF